MEEGLVSGCVSPGEGQEAVSGKYRAKDFSTTQQTLQSDGERMLSCPSLNAYCVSLGASPPSIPTRTQQGTCDHPHFPASGTEARRGAGPCAQEEGGSGLESNPPDCKALCWEELLGGLKGMQDQADEGFRHGESENPSLQGALPALRVTVWMLPSANHQQESARGFYFFSH